VSIPYQDQYGRDAGKKLKLATFLSTCMAPDPAMRQKHLAKCSEDGHGALPDYIFERPQPDTPIQRLFRAHIPAFVDWTARSLTGDVPEGCPQFFVGPPGSGAPLHQHQSGYNMLFSGVKHWYLLRPEHSYTTNLHVKQWLVLEYTLRSGVI
jgi:hypothetical protein